jgi:hypothetical protein
MQGVGMKRAITWGPGDVSFYGFSVKQGTIKGQNASLNVACFTTC